MFSFLQGAVRGAHFAILVACVFNLGTNRLFCGLQSSVYAVRIACTDVSDLLLHAGKSPPEVTAGVTARVNRCKKFLEKFLGTASTL